MSNATQSLAGARITSLLDANSFVEIGQSVTARTTDFNMTEKKAPSDGVITGYGVIDGRLVYVRTHPYLTELLVKCMQRRFPESTIWQ